MVKKYISGENLMYVLSIFEKQMIQLIDERTHLERAESEDLQLIFSNNSNESN